MNSREKNKKSFNFIEKKNCAINSILEINCFLSNLTKIKTIKKLVNQNKKY